MVLEQNKDFFSSGEYGCAIYPRVKCGNNKKKNNRKDSQMISKVTIQDFYSENEYSIGKILKKNNDLGYFIPIEKKCSINNKKVDEINSKYDCKATQKNKKDKKFVLLYSKFDPSQQLSDVLHKSENNIKLIYKYYLFTLKCIDILLQNNIVHHDLHLANIILNKNDEFKLIDFGLSIQYDKVKNINGTINFDYLDPVLITFDDTWCYWSIEKHFLNYLVFNNRHLSDEILVEIIHNYYDNNKVFNILYTKDELYKYKKTVFYFYREKYSSLSIEDTIIEILDNSYKTWDLYQLSYLMIYLLQHKLDNPILSLFVDMFKKNLHYDYSKRLSIEKILKLNHELLSEHKKSKVFHESVHLTKEMLTHVTLSQANSIH